MIKVRRKRKPCYFCKNKVEYVNYKDVDALKNFIHQNAQILPRRVTGTCAKHQRVVATAIKRSRELALLAYVNE